MRLRVCVLALLTAFVLALTRTPASAAPSLSPPVPGAALLGFGVAYGSRVHTGLDLAAPAGSPVSAAAAGTVTFAGRLPSDGADVLAVTITTPDGFKVTCLPLAAATVAKGEEVSPGEAIGSLAGQGDASSPDAHVHLSVREGEAYLDPAKLLPAPPAPETPPAADPAPAPAPAPVAGSPAPAAPAASAPAGAGQFAPPPVAAPAAVSAAPVAPAASAGAAAPVSGPAPAPAAAPFAGTAPGAAPSAAGDGPAAVATRDVRSSAPAAASPAVAAAALASVSRSFARRPAPTPARPATPVAPSALAALSSGYSRLRMLASALAALLVSAALLWPAWRRLSAVGPAPEPAPIRVRA